MNLSRASCLFAAAALAAGGFSAAAFASGSGSGSASGGGNSGPGGGAGTTTNPAEPGHDAATTTAPAPTGDVSPASSPAQGPGPAAAPAPTHEDGAQTSAVSGGATAVSSSGRTHALSPAQSGRRTGARAHVRRHGPIAQAPATVPRLEVTSARHATKRSARPARHVQRHVAAVEEASFALAHDDPPPVARLFAEPLARWIAVVVLGALLSIAVLLAAGIWAKRRIVNF